MRIVVDAMGSDRCPGPDVDGAVQAARATGETMILVGDNAAILSELAKRSTDGLSIEVVHAPEAITMHDKPSQVNRAKPQSSMAIGMGLVRDGKADAFVTAGNTGAALALATLGVLRRIPGVKRPALTSLIQIGGQTLILLDLGANADARPEWLVQFAIMGSLYAQHVLGQEKPRVALLSNGEEEGKGNELVKTTAGLLSQSGLNFTGNIEPKELLKGAADVIVADGFVGNIALKSMEALGDTLFGMMIDGFKGSPNPLVKIGALLVRPVLRDVYRQVDPFEIGGAPLLGVNGVVIVGHGRTNAKGMKNAIVQARKAVQGNIVNVIRDGLARYADEPDELGTPVASA
ncbi:MAG: phosphate acyltransferase PlsX [Aggregatilineales bacterium]